LQLKPTIVFNPSIDRMIKQSNLKIVQYLVFAAIATNSAINSRPSCVASAEVSMGTTIFAMRYKSGVVVGADSRTSVSGYVSNRYATKISFVLEDDFGIDLDPPSSDLQLNSALLDEEDKQREVERMQQEETQLTKSTCCICRSGSAADTQYIADTVRHQLLRRKVMQHTSSSVSNVANLIKNYLLNNDLQASLICAGYDHIRDEGVIFSIDLGGTCMEQPIYACNGSGSGYILGYIDEYFHSMGPCSTLTEEEAVKFVADAIELAMDRDGSSGGVVRIYVIDRDGKKEILRTPEYTKEKQSDGDIRSNLAHFAPATRI
jgi:20S proteasome subunit beta 1